MKNKLQLPQIEDVIESHTGRRQRYKADMCIRITDMGFGLALWFLILAIGAAPATTLAPRTTLFVHYHKTGNAISEDIAEICRATTLVDGVCQTRHHQRQRSAGDDDIGCQQIKCDQGDTPGESS
jgi:hypothetical protein